MTYDNVVAELVTQVPELAPRLAEHQQDYDEILPHVFFGDVVRYVEAHCDELTTAMPDLGTVQCGAYRVLQFLEEAMASDDEQVQELVSASFVESFVLGTEAYDRVLAVCGPRLREEFRVIREWRPDPDTI